MISFYYELSSMLSAVGLMNTALKIIFFCFGCVLVKIIIFFMKISFFMLCVIHQCMKSLLEKPECAVVRNFVKVLDFVKKFCNFAKSLTFLRLKCVTLKRCKRRLCNFFKIPLIVRISEIFNIIHSSAQLLINGCV